MVNDHNLRQNIDNKNICNIGNDNTIVEIHKC